jgi:hypothetical protein
MDQNEMSKFYRGPSIDASYQISIHLGKQFQRRFFATQAQLIAEPLVFNIVNFKLLE